MVQIFRLRRSSLRRKIPVVSILSLLVTVVTIGISVGTTSGAPIFSSPVTAAQSRLYYDANVRIRKDGLAFLVGAKAAWLGLTVLNNGNSYTDSVNINPYSADDNGNKYPSIAFSPVDGTGYVAWNHVHQGSGITFETYIQVIPAAYDGVGNKSLNSPIRLFDVPGVGYQLAQPTISVDTAGNVYVVGYAVFNPVQLRLVELNSTLTSVINQYAIDSQPPQNSGEMDPMMCIDSSNNIHVVASFPNGTDPNSPLRLFAWSNVGSAGFVKTDITPSGWGLIKGRRGKDIACAADGSVYVAVNNSRQYDLWKRTPGAGGGEKWVQTQSNLFNEGLNSSVGVGTSLDGRVWAVQGDGATSGSDPNPITGTNVKYSTDGGITFSANERAIPTTAYQDFSVAIDGNGPGGKVHLVGSFYFTSSDFSVTTQYAWATTIVALPAPTNLTATAVSQTQINLNWTATNPAADQYQILRSTSPGGPYTQIDTVPGNTTTYQNTGLTFGTPYYYQVTATKSGYNNSGPSNIAGATTFGPVGIVFAAQPGSGVAGVGINPAPTVRVVDQAGNTVTGYNGSVTFSIEPGTGTPGATLSGTTNQAISNGVSSFAGTPLTINSIGTNYQLRAVSGNFAVKSNPFNQTGNLAVALVTNPLTATVPFSVRVTVQVNSGATDTNYNGPVNLAFSPAGGVYYYGASTAVAASGVATFTNQMIDTAGSGYSYSASLPSGLASGSLGGVNVAGYSEPGNATQCTRILFSPTPSTCSSNTLSGAFSAAGSKPVYLDHKSGTGFGASMYVLPGQALTIPAGSWLDAGCGGPSGNPWGMQVTISASNTLTANGGSTFLRGLYLNGVNGSNALLRVLNGQTGNTVSCSKVKVGP